MLVKGAGEEQEGAERGSEMLPLLPGAWDMATATPPQVLAPQRETLRRRPPQVSATRESLMVPFLSGCPQDLLWGQSEGA